MTKTQRLVKIYTDSLQRLIAEVRKRIDRGAGTISQDMMIVAIDQEFRRLNVETAAWAQEAIKEAYERGAMDAWRAVAAGDASVRPFAAFGGLNRPAAELLAHNTQDFLRIANDLIARQARDVIRRVGVEVTGKKFAEMLTVRETKKLMETRLAEEGFGTQVPWRNGRGSMRTDSYAELVARTTTAEATNTGTINQMNAMGQHLVKMTAHNTTCKVCASRQGRVYRTIEFPEGDPRQQFPHIREGLPRWPEYKTVHPNCAHRILPYIWSQKTEEEQKEALSRAGEPFNHDPRGEAERLRYEKAQRENRERLRDRKEWEAFKESHPDAVPKTFSGYRRQRAADLEAYRQLQSDIGKENSPKSFTRYQLLRYNSGEDWEILQAYSTSVRNGDLSALTGIDHYRSVIAEVKTELVGLTTADGVKVSGFKYHFIDRTIGSYHQKREGVPIIESKHTLLTPTKIRERIHPSGEISRQYRGDSCYVTINPEKGILIQANPRK